MGTEIDVLSEREWIVQEARKQIIKNLVMTLIHFANGTLNQITGNAKLLIERGLDLDITTSVSTLEDGITGYFTIRIRGFDPERLYYYRSYFMKHGAFRNEEKVAFMRALQVLLGYGGEQRGQATSGENITS